MLAKIVRECYGKEISECRKEELYHALLTLVQKRQGKRKRIQERRNCITYQQSF